MQRHEKHRVRDRLSPNFSLPSTLVYTPIEDGWIMAQVPELPGAVTQGRDMDEAREMIQEAVEHLLQSYATHGKNS